MDGWNLYKLLTYLPTETTNIMYISTVELWTDHDAQDCNSGNVSFSEEPAQRHQRGDDLTWPDVDDAEVLAPLSYGLTHRHTHIHIDRQRYRETETDRHQHGDDFTWPDGNDAEALAPRHTY